jgi:hypothetical protein
MTYDPYDMPRDLPKTEPRHVYTEDNHATIWLPLAIVIALMLGIGYYFYGYGGNGTSQVRADSGAVTKSEPSPN